MRILVHLIGDHQLAYLKNLSSETIATIMMARSMTSELSLIFIVEGSFSRDISKVAFMEDY